MKNMENKSILKKITGSREAILLLIVAILAIFIEVKSGGAFFQLDNLNGMFKNYAVDFVIAIGMMLVMLTGGIDISVGSTLALSGMCASLIFRDHQGLPIIVVFLIAIAVGVCCGLLIGLVISYGKVPPIIATMGCMNAFRGATYLVAHNEWVAAMDFTESYKNFAQKSYLGFGLINNLMVIVIVLYIVFFCILKWTPAGRKIYAVGSNSEAAAVSGINVKKVKTACYVILGAVTGLAGGMFTSLYASAQGNMGEGLEMDCIAACVVGGVSMTGGKGNIVGVFLGALVIAIIGKGLPLIGVSQFWQKAIKGVIILVFVILNVLIQRSVDRAALKRREI